MADDEPQRVTAEDVRGLSEETGRLATAIETVAARQNITEVKVKANAKEVSEAKRLGKRANVNSTIAIAALVMVVVLGFWFRADSNNKTGAIVAERQSRTVASCIQFNVNQKNQRTAIVDSITDSLLPLVTSQKGQDFVSQLHDNLAKNVAIALPYRDCSDEGITDFLKHPPADPALTG